VAERQGERGCATGDDRGGLRKKKISESYTNHAARPLYGNGKKEVLGGFQSKKERHVKNKKKTHVWELDEKNSRFTRKRSKRGRKHLLKLEKVQKPTSGNYAKHPPWVTIRMAMEKKTAGGGKSPL